MTDAGRDEGKRRVEAVLVDAAEKSWKCPDPSHDDRHCGYCEGAQAGMDHAAAVATPLIAAAVRHAKDLRALVSDSAGVTGLHLNGDDAPWDSLLRGGEFEDWLGSFDDLEDAIAAILPAPDADGGDDERD